MWTSRVSQSLGEFSDALEGSDGEGLENFLIVVLLRSRRGGNGGGNDSGCPAVGIGIGCEGGGLAILSFRELNSLRM